MFAPLASEADLLARNVTVPDQLDVTALLQAASDEVREAAGCPISEETSTLPITVDCYEWFDLPGAPVTAVTSVIVEGVPMAGWELFGATVRMPHGWTHVLPVTVTVTYTHGLPEVPADIVDLVCGMVSIAATQSAGYGTAARSQSVRLGEYAETTLHPPGTESPSPMALPDATRQRLRARFGNSVAMVGQRRR